ncbi:TetR/AcrR family transcriptional regulator [Dactylosporangium sp. CA-092794]|uniref:TetR/AcrR family transcriptional regulator n=1 Tax=Dactylosporangium sp. CA-092794 TaxID=3239929 RepID=UPI003D8C60AF
MSPARQRRTGGEESSARRSQLLDAAERVFHRRGYSAATIQEIADEFGILKGSTYHYVRSKEQLLLEVEERAHRHVFAEVSAAVDSVSEPIERLWMFIHSLILLNARTPTMGSLTKATLDLPPGAGRDRIAQARHRFEDLLRTLLDDAVEARAVPAGLNGKVVAFGIFGLINSIYLWYRPGGPISPDELAHTYADSLIAGLVSAPPAGSATWQRLAAEQTAPVPS